MKKHIISFVHQPKKVIVVSLVVAFCIGVLGHWYINKKPANLVGISDKAIAPKNLSLSYISSGKVKDVLVKAGDQVKKGQVLATLTPDNMDGTLVQAEAAYEIAKANYQKVINGATGASINLAKTAVNSATINLNEVKKQQNILVSNAYYNFLNSTPEATPSDNTKDYTAPFVGGSYGLGKAGIIELHFYYSSGGVSFDVSGITTGNGSCNSITSQPIGDSGLYIKCSSTIIDISNWEINLPNEKASNYLTNKNAYELALQTQAQAVAMAQASLDQANANLESVATSARPEDVTIAKAQVESAEGILISNAAYGNTVITSPSDGTVVFVSVVPGQVVASNIAVIELIVNGPSN